MKLYANSIRPHTKWLPKKGKKSRYVDGIENDRVRWFHWSGDGGECSIETFLRWARKQAKYYP